LGKGLVAWVPNAKTKRNKRFEREVNESEEVMRASAGNDDDGDEYDDEGFPEDMAVEEAGVNDGESGDDCNDQAEQPAVVRRNDETTKWSWR